MSLLRELDRIGALRALDDALAQHPAPARSGHARQRAGRRRAGLAGGGAGPCRLRPGAAAPAGAMPTWPGRMPHGWAQALAASPLRRHARRRPMRRPPPRRWCSNTACSTCAATANTNAGWRCGLRAIAAAAMPETGIAAWRRCSRSCSPTPPAAMPRPAPPRWRCAATCCWSPAAPAPARPPPSPACWRCASRRRSRPATRRRASRWPRPPAAPPTAWPKACAAPCGRWPRCGIDDALAALPDEASTLHRLLGVIPDAPRFRHHADNPLPFDIVVVDEASMVDLPLMCKLAEAVAMAEQARAQ